MAVRVSFIVEGEEEPVESSWIGLIGPILQRNSATVDLFETTPQGPVDFRTSTDVLGPDFWTIELYLALPTRGRTVADALAFGRDVQAVLEAADAGQMTESAACTLLEAGRADLLVGQVEGPWIDCKEQPYPNSEYGRFELAKDVSSFANSGLGGLIVIGLRTRRAAGRDVIASVRPVPRDDRLPDRYRKLIDHRVYPRPAGLQIANVRQEQATLVLIAIPPQPPALRPFLVRGVLRGERIVGSHVAIFARRGDATIEASAEELHSLLVAGRAALSYASP